MGKPWKKQKREVRWLASTAEKPERDKSCCPTWTLFFTQPGTPLYQMVPSPIWVGFPRSLNPIWKHLTTCSEVVLLLADPQAHQVHKLTTRLTTDTQREENSRPRRQNWHVIASHTQRVSHGFHLSLPSQVDGLLQNEVPGVLAHLPVPAIYPKKQGNF